jgi:hypothetical protein
MPSESDQVPAGWYPAPNGGRRYWDGQRWLALPDPDAQHPAVPGATEEASGRPKKAVLIASVVAAVILVVAGIGFIIWKSNHDIEMQNAASAASSSKAAADEEADRVRRDIDDQRAKRAGFVKEIEGTIKTLAEKQSAEGLFAGPVLSASCSPVNGGSTDDLTAKTTVFECFVANKTNDDGSQSGVRYHATANWDTREYTYGFGAPR